MPKDASPNGDAPGVEWSDAPLPRTSGSTLTRPAEALVHAGRARHGQLCRQQQSPHRRPEASEVDGVVAPLKKSQSSRVTTPRERVVGRTVGFASMQRVLVHVVL